MKLKLCPCPGGLFSILAALVLTAAPNAKSEEVKLKLLSSGAEAKLRSYVPRQLKLSGTKPSGLKTVPEGVEAPLYGELQFGPKEEPTTFVILLDEPAGKTARLWVDANANGDLTDDPAAEWTSKTNKSKEGKVFTMYNGGATLKLGTGAEALEMRLNMYRFDKADPGRAALTNTLLYYSDYARTGEVTLGGKSLNAILADDSSSGDFRGQKGKQGGAVNLILDINGDGKFDRRQEGLDVNKPFNIGGTTYEIRGMTASGAAFQIEKSVETAEETKPFPNLSAGQKSLPFEAKTTGSETVQFPGSYKGKLVMLDFWATWCPPCREEIPGLSAAYNKYHEQGFEVLGVSLDKTNAEAALATFTKEQKMPWLQIYDGKYWAAKVVMQYNVRSIPAAFLVDGDTGIIVAEGDQLRGEDLDKTLTKALAKKKGKQGHVE